MALPQTIHDYPTKPNAKTRAAMKREVFDGMNHFEEVNFKALAIGTQKQAELNEIAQRLDAIEVAIGATARDHERLGYPVRVDPVTNKKTKVDWIAEQYPERAELIARRAKLNALKVPATPFERLQSWVRKNANGPWRKHGKTYHEGDTRARGVIRAECVATRLKAEAAIKGITEALAHSDDAKARADYDIDRLAAKGAPDMSGVFRGYTIQSNGMIADDVHPEIYWSQTTLHTMEQDKVPAIDMLATFLWFNVDDAKRRVHALIDAQADDENAIRGSDKPALLAALNAELLEAQRREESAYRLCELENQFVERPQGWPVEVMLQIEPDTTPTTKPAPITYEKPTDATAQGADLSASASIMPGDAAAMFEGD